MSKMRYFNKKISKIAKCWELCAPQRPISLRFGWPEVTWFA